MVVGNMVDKSRRDCRFQFGVFEVDVAHRELRRQGAVIKLQGTPFQLLVLLLQHAGRSTTREELREGLWPAGTFVNFDANLKTAVNKVRQALGDSAKNPIFIETIPRIGYRFLAPVQEIQDDASYAKESQNALLMTLPGGRVSLAHAGMISRLSWKRKVAGLLLILACIAALTYLLKGRITRAITNHRHVGQNLTMPIGGALCLPATNDKVVTERC